MLSLSLVMQGQALHGLYIGTLAEAWNQAADLSEQLNIIYVDRPYRQVLLAPAEMYDDLGTAAKAMYKTEPAIANGGEVINYAPHITEVSYSHGKLLDEVGYHVKEYFLKQWERFQGVPGGILAHSTHVKGTGTYDAERGMETSRITVTLATGIPEERCRRINLGCSMCPMLARCSTALAAWRRTGGCSMTDKKATQAALQCLIEEGSIGQLL